MVFIFLLEVESCDGATKLRERSKYGFGIFRRWPYEQIDVAGGS